MPSALLFIKKNLIYVPFLPFCNDIVSPPGKIFLTFYALRCYVIYKNTQPNFALSDWAYVAEWAGFEPACRSSRQHDFQSCSLRPLRYHSVIVFVIKLLLENRFPLLSFTIITYVSRFCNCFRLFL